MKTIRGPRKSIILILLALGLGLGGWGILTAVDADSGGAPRWWEKWFGGSGAADGAERGGPGKGRGKDGGRDGNPDSNSPSVNPAGLDSAAGSPSKKAFDPHALPIGLTKIDGEAGTGINRVVRKNGVWFPVYSPGPESGSGVPPLTVIPLSIASGNPLPGKVNEPFRHEAEAIGGTPPYQWSAGTDIAAAGFSLSPTDGILTGFSTQPVTIRLQLKVTDAAKATDSAELKIVIRPDRALTLDSTALPTFGFDGPVEFQFAASGGVPPYQWTATPPPPAGLTLHAGGTRAGLLEGPAPTEAMEMPVVITVTDSQDEKVTKPFTLKIAAGLDITTPSALPPAVPGQAYQGTFQAEGGTPPYQWKMVSGEFPGEGWKLSEEGILTNSSNHEGSVGRFILEVTDAAGETFEKSFTLVVSDLLVLVPSREKVGVAWHPAATAQVLAAAGIPAVGYRVSRDGVPVYQGAGTNFVDHGVHMGSTPRYTL
ncbi:MAG: Ig family protein, partial [Verrucomicrobiales bacterium]|nr:Ig family protein [Verrucomicrobiales bacterium]